jgi:nucleoid-associated protein YgaU
MAIILTKEIYNLVVNQKIENEQVIADIYANFDNYTMEEKYNALDIIDNLNIANEELQKYIVVYNNKVENLKQSEEYIVLYGDTIQSIAQKVTGNYENWKKIMVFNKLSDPDIEPGTTILIPEDIND